ncbi:uncharacterized protein BJ171DRAFT_475200 [Polychytrium aggregatum]|uniref:uncharacterized protein n=1 Tax=Polychytrium aggregatum TaxID=110093 RepID=UPI0022FEE726|nr:uncharacterized protein BJ171DRAFT_475200 [Polychytrium aggregatum]KAI9204220.1 hypothetical protein BJ171DRAFT_475200 [Polychytrium aggregatum]
MKPSGLIILLSMGSRIPLAASTTTCPAPSLSHPPLASSPSAPSMPLPSKWKGPTLLAALPAVEHRLPSASIQAADPLELFESCPLAFNSSQLWPQPISLASHRHLQQSPSGFPAQYPSPSHRPLQAPWPRLPQSDSARALRDSDNTQSIHDSRDCYGSNNCNSCDDCDDCDDSGDCTLNSHENRCSHRHDMPAAAVSTASTASIPVPPNSTDPSYGAPARTPPSITGLHLHRFITDLRRWRLWISQSQSEQFYDLMLLVLLVFWCGGTLIRGWNSEYSHSFGWGLKTDGLETSTEAAPSDPVDTEAPSELALQSAMRVLEARYICQGRYRRNLWRV